MYRGYPWLVVPVQDAYLFPGEQRSVCLPLRLVPLTVCSNTAGVGTREPAYTWLSRDIK